jgi:hypothetical protein
MAWRGWKIIDWMFWVRKTKIDEWKEKNEILIKKIIKLSKKIVWVKIKIWIINLIRIRYLIINIRWKFWLKWPRKSIIIRIILNIKIIKLNIIKVIEFKSQWRRLKIKY